MPQRKILLKTSVTALSDDNINASALAGVEVVPLQLRIRYQEMLRESESGYALAADKIAAADQTLRKAIRHAQVFRALGRPLCA